MEMSPLSLASRLWEFWRIRGFLVEGSAWLERTLELAPANAPELRAAGEYALGKLSIDLANYEAAETHFRNSADLMAGTRRSAESRRCQECVGDRQTQY